MTDTQRYASLAARQARAIEHSRSLVPWFREAREALAMEDVAELGAPREPSLARYANWLNNRGLPPSGPTKATPRNSGWSPKTVSDKLYIDQVIPAAATKALRNAESHMKMIGEYDRWRDVRDKLIRDATEVGRLIRGE